MHIRKRFNPLVLAVPLLIYGVYVQALLARTEDARTRLISAPWLYLVFWLGGAGLGLWLSRTLARAPLKTALYVGALLFGLLGAALFLGRWHRGLPYLPLGPLNLHVTELLASLMLLPISAVAVLPIRWYVRIAWTLPVLLLLLGLGSAHGAWVLGCSSAAIFARRALDEDRANVPRGAAFAAAVIFLGIGAYPFIMALGRGVLTSPERFGPWVLYDPEAGANAHTEFVLSFVALHHGLAAVLIVLPAIVLSALSFACNDRPIRSNSLEHGALLRCLGSGFGAYLLASLAMNLSAALSWMSVPASGVFVPWLSFGGSLSLSHGMLLMVLVLGDDGRPLGYKSPADAS